MHLIIKENNLKKIKKFLSISSNSLKEKKLNITVDKESVSLLLFTDNSLIKLVLESGEELIIKKNGQVQIDTKTFSNLINSINLKNNLEIYCPEKNYLQFFSGSYECDLILSEFEKNDQFNIEKNLDNSQVINIPYEILKNSYSHLKDLFKSFENTLSNNKVLSNVHFKKQKNSSVIEVWASDFYRTIYGEFNLETPESFELNISPSILVLILNLYSQYEKQNINFHLINSGEYLVCDKDNYFMKAKLNNAVYPSFIHWFNMPSKVAFNVNKDDLMSVIDRNLLLVDRDIKTTLYRVDKSELFIECRDNKKGKCKEKIEIENFDKEVMEFYLNNELLKDLVKSIDSEKIVFKIYDSLKPIVLLSQNPSNFKQFILPARNV